MYQLLANTAEAVGYAQEYRARFCSEHGTCDRSDDRFSGFGTGYYKDRASNNAKRFFKKQ